MDGFPVNITDIGILAVMLISGVFAFVRGFVHEFLAVIAWIGAALATIYGIDLVIPLARQLTTMRPVADIGSGVAIFIVVLVGLTILTRMLSLRVQASSLSTLDRSLGLLFGILRGVVLVCLAWLLVSWAVPRKDLPDLIVEARSLPLVEQGKDLLITLLPEEMQPSELQESEAQVPALEHSFEDFVRPRAKVAGPDQPTGYNDRQRKDMDRLNESLQ